MQTVTVSEKGQVVIPIRIRRRLGIAPGCQLQFSLEGEIIHAEVKRLVQPSTVDSGFAMLTCQKPGKRRLSDFDVVHSMLEAVHDRT